MKNRKYKVCRDNIYVGEVIRTRCVYHNNIVDNTRNGELRVDRWRSYRSILFVPNENNLADDLLYNSPNYPVLNITNNEKCLDFDENIILINDACNLSELLKYFGYNEELTYQDILKIRRTFFSEKFLRDNCELFGYREINPEEMTYYKHDIEITDPKKIKKCITYYKRKQLLGCRDYCSIKENVLPREYWHILSERRDSAFMEQFSRNNKKANAFKPYKREVKVKKLSR